MHATTDELEEEKKEAEAEKVFFFLFYFLRNAMKMLFQENLRVVANKKNETENTVTHKCLH